MKNNFSGYFLKLKDKNLNNKKLYISFLNKHKVSQKLVNCIEFVQCIVDKGTFSFQCFTPSCSEESNLMVGRLVNIEIPNCDMNLSSIMICYIIHFLQLAISCSIVDTFSEVSSKIGTSSRFSAS